MDYHYIREIYILNITSFDASKKPSCLLTNLKIFLQEMNTGQFQYIISNRPSFFKAKEGKSRPSLKTEQLANFRRFPMSNHHRKRDLALYELFSYLDISTSITYQYLKLIDNFYSWILSFKFLLIYDKIFSYMAVFSS